MEVQLVSNDLHISNMSASRPRKLRSTGGSNPEASDIQSLPQAFTDRIQDAITTQERLGESVCSSTITALYPHVLQGVTITAPGRSLEILHHVMTSPFPDLVQKPEHPNRYLPGRIHWDNLIADDAAKLIEWKARSGRKDFVAKYVLPRLHGAPSGIVARNALSNHGQRGRKKRNMFATTASALRDGNVTDADRTVMDQLSDEQLLHVSHLGFPHSTMNKNTNSTT
jgi:hypothetical protein